MCDELVIDDEAMLDLCEQNPPKWFRTYIVPRERMPGLISLFK